MSRFVLYREVFFIRSVPLYVTIICAFSIMIDLTPFSSLR